MIRLLLASASPARTSTLSAAGIVHDVRVSDVDEPAVLAEQARTAADGAPAPTPADQVLALARAKAEDVAARVTSTGRTLVLGCDSMLEADLGDGVEVVGKPHDPATATHRWRAMRGRTGVLHTGHWLVDVDPAGATGPAASPRPGGDGIPEASPAVGDVSSAVIHFANLTDAEIDAYVASGEPLRVAGGFTLDGLGGPFVDRIEGDHHGVVGISLPLLRDLLGQRGVAVTELWG